MNARKLAELPGRTADSAVRPALKAERVQETLRAFPGWQVRADGPGLIRRYEFPSVRDSGAFAAFAASLLAELDAVPELEIVAFERVAVLEGRTREAK